MELIIYLIIFGLAIAFFVYVILPISGFVLLVCMGIILIRVFYQFFKALMSNMTLKSDRKETLKNMHTYNSSIIVSALTFILTTLINIIKAIFVFFANVTGITKASSNETKRGYFFGPCYIQIANSIIEGTSKSFNFIDDLQELIVDFTEDLGDLVIPIMGKVVSFIAAVFGYVIVTFAVYYLSLVLGTITIAVALISMIAYLIVGTADKMYLKSKYISSECPECHERSLIPAFECPNCNELHYRLVPNSNGIFTHQCQCGTKLPTTFFNGRSKLNAYCPNCGSKLVGSQYRQVVIQLAGGSNSGKTVFLSGFYLEYLKKLNSIEGIEYEIPDDYEDKFNDLSYYSNGNLPEATQELNSNMYALKIKGEKISPQRQFTIYDIAGEMFNDGVADSETVQNQYKTCNGVILLIDPFANDLIKNEAEIEGYDSSRYNTLNAEDLVNNFINYLMGIGATKVGKKSQLPIAVVLGKADVPALKNELNDDLIKNEYEMEVEDPAQLSFESYRTQRIKEFMEEHDMGNAISILETQFSNVEFFIASGIGHKPNGKAYTPFGVLECVEWILKRTDKKYYEITEGV